MKQVKPSPFAASFVLSSLLVVAPSMAQNAGQSTRAPTAQELTRSLNSRPSQAAPTAPVATPSTVVPRAQQARPAPEATTSVPMPASTQARPVVPASAAATRATTQATPATAPATATATPAPAAAAPATPAPAPMARPVPLTASAIAALPFRIDLRGAQIVERPAGPTAKIYSISRSERPLLMIYAGPQSDYPIYDGQQAEVAGRTSIIVSEGGARRAVEHLFRREDKQPADIHVWLISTDGSDGVLAEQIGQSVDPR